MYDIMFSFLSFLLSLLPSIVLAHFLTYTFTFIVLIVLSYILADLPADKSGVFCSLFIQWNQINDNCLIKWLCVCDRIHRTYRTFTHVSSLTK